MGGFEERKVTKMKIQYRRKNPAAVCLASALVLFPAISETANHEANHSPPQSGASIAGAMAVDFDLKTLDGRAIRLDTFRGKPLVINFFATWCDPCREEMPLINGLASESNNLYSVLGIAVRDDRGAVVQYAKEAGLMFRIALDLNSKTQRAYRIFGPPATFFIDGQGVVRDVVHGPITAERAREGLKKTGVIR